MATVKTKLRTVAFFRLVIESEEGDRVDRFKQHAWSDMLAGFVGLPIEERTFQGVDRRLIGEALVVDDDYALKLMEPRDEESWLEILRLQDGAASEIDANLGTLVETSIVVFLGFGNLIGIIRGSTASPSHTAVAEWLGNIKRNGKQLLAAGEGRLKAEVAMNRRQAERLNASNGVSSASVRISTGKAEALEAAGSGWLAGTLRTLKQTYGDMIVTVTMRIPRGKANDAAREELKRETQRLRSVAGDAESVSATLVTYDAEARAHAEEVDFIAQRITTKKHVPAFDQDGSPIRNASAVRAILAAADEMRRELHAADDD